MITLENKPFLKAEAYYVDARFYRMKSDKGKGKGVTKAGDIPSTPKCTLVELPNLELHWTTTLAKLTIALKY